MNRTLATVAIALTTLGAQAASAQLSLRDIEGAGRSETRATASITIPLGGRGHTARDRAPRIDLAMQTAQIQPTDLRIAPVVGVQDGRRGIGMRTAVSLTLEQNPRMLFNGQRVATFGPRLSADEEDEADGEGGGNSTIWIVAGGVVVLGALTAVALNQAVEESIRGVFPN